MGDMLLEAPQAGAAPAAGQTAAPAGQRTVVERLPAPKEFFAAAHHRLLCLGDATLAGAAAGLGSAAGSAGGTLAAGGANGYGKGGLSVGSAAGSLRWDAEGDRELCVRAMAAVYSAHAGVIGPVEGIPHLAALLDAAPSRALRQHLLLLLEALVAPSCLAAPSTGTASSAEASSASLPPPPPSGQEAAARAAHANGLALLEAGGVQLMADLVAGGWCGEGWFSSRRAERGGSPRQGAKPGGTLVHGWACPSAGTATPIRLPRQ